MGIGVLCSGLVKRAFQCTAISPLSLSQSLSHRLHRSYSVQAGKAVNKGAKAMYLLVTKSAESVQCHVSATTTDESSPKQQSPSDSTLVPHVRLAVHTEYQAVFPGNTSLPDGLPPESEGASLDPAHHLMWHQSCS